MRRIPDQALWWCAGVRPPPGAHARAGDARRRSPGLHHPGEQRGRGPAPGRLVDMVPGDRAAGRTARAACVWGSAGTYALPSVGGREGWYVLDGSRIRRFSLTSGRPRPSGTCPRPARPDRPGWRSSRPPGRPGGHTGARRHRAGRRTAAAPADGQRQLDRLHCPASAVRAGHPPTRHIALLRESINRADQCILRRVTM
jgi:hypothetical protein